MNASRSHALPNRSIRFAALPLLLGALAGCAGVDDSSPRETEAPAQTPNGAAIALRIEQAERRLDLGQGAREAAAALEAVANDPAATPGQRDQARLSWSRALEAQGDMEGAIRAVEELLAQHEPGQRWPLAEAAEARLRKLLTGNEGKARRGRPEDTRSPSAFARALAKYFDVDPAARSIEVSLLAFGGDRDTSDMLATFAIDRAIRASRREACPLCEDASVLVKSSRTGSWLGIPAARSKLATGLAVYYFDLGEGRIPARYDALLPVPSAEVVAHLEKGEGLVAARERPGAPPAILIAAPREAQLADVETALSEMKTLPVEKVVVPVKPNLKPQEIQAVVRGEFKAFRACYEALLKQSPAAAGKVSLAFEILGSGAADGVTALVEEGTLRDATFERCLQKAAAALTFPATGGKTTVKYPIAFSPGE